MDDAITIVVLGDSLAAGMGLAEADAFPALVEAMLCEAGHPVHVLNAGVSGDTTAGGLSRIDWVLQQRPEILVVELGGNDALRGQSLANTESNLLARDERIILVPGFVREVGADPELMQPDGLHPTADGQRLLAATLYTYLEAIAQEIEASPHGE
jgi:acyl-CoA thioesterase-1